MSVKILSFSGSLRTGSWNRKIVEIASEGARDAGGEVKVVSLRDYPMPVFDEDFESAHGLPESVLEFRALLRGSDGFLIGVPEYNGGITAALKNAIDWASRPREGEAPLACFTGKVCGLVAASPGALGGIRGLPMTRQILSGIGVLVVAKQAAVPKVHELFDEAGVLGDQKTRMLLEGVGAEVVRVGQGVRPPMAGGRVGR